MLLPGYQRRRKMINFEEEIERFKPSLEVEEIGRAHV